MSRLEFAFGDLPDLTIARRLSIFTHIGRQKAPTCTLLFRGVGFDLQFGRMQLSTFATVAAQSGPWLDADTNRSISLGVCAVALSVHRRLVKYCATASTQVSNTSSASRPRTWPSVGRKTGYPPLWTAPTIMRLS